MKQVREYKTRQGEIIVDYLKSKNGNHVTAEQIIEELKNDGISIGKSTVYRQLDRLVNDGYVRKYFFQEGTSACFEYINNDKNCRQHFHFKCLGCGKLFHVECNYLQSADEHIFKEHGFEVDNTKTVFYGKCNKCLH